MASRTRHDIIAELLFAVILESLEHRETRLDCIDERSVSSLRDWLFMFSLSLRDAVYESHFLIVLVIVANDSVKRNVFGRILGNFSN